MRKLFRKPMALLLALALIAGSLSVAVFALTVDEHGIFNVYTKFYRVDSNGDPLEDEISDVSYAGADTCDGTLYVKKGDRIKAVMSAESLMADGSDPDSEFNVIRISLFLSFNKNMLELEPAYINSDPQKKQTFSSPIGDISVLHGDNMAATLGISDPNKKFINAYSAEITDIGNNHSDEGFVLTRDGLGKDIITWYFTVLNDANVDLSQESLFAVEEASVCTLDDQADTLEYTTFITSYDEEGELASDLYYLDVNSYSENLAFGGTVTYNTNNTTLGVTGTIAAANGITDKGNGVYEEVGQADAAASLPAVTAAAGTTFIGWATTQNATTPNVTAATLKAENPDTLYAVYTQGAFVKYVYNNGTPDNSTPANVGDPITAPSDPSWTGHNFLGWTDGTNTYTSAQIGSLTVPSGGITFTAIWDYTLTYEYTYENVKDADKLAAPALVQLEEGDDIPSVAAATKDGYTVTDWVYYDADDNEITDGKMPAGNITAKATQSGVPYTLTYTFTGEAPAGVTAPTDNGTYYIGDSKVLETVTAPEGYIFSGWKLNDAVVTEVTFGAGNVEVTGEWTKGEYTITYEYTYENVKDADKLEAPALVAKAYGADLPEVAAATKDGYTVTDWVYYDADDNEITDGKMPAGNVTAKATQSGVPYTLTYTFTGEAPAGVTAPTDNGTYYIGDSKVLETVTAPEGYTFSGWKLNDAVVTEVTFGAGNVEVTGEWTKAEYTITYEYTYENVKDADKLEAPAPATKAYGADLPEVAAATKDGYTVTDWVYYDADDNEITDGKMPAGNVTAKATQSGIPYTLTYTFTGEAPAGVTAPTDNGTYYIGDSKTLETVTAPEGYTFSGWKLNDAVVTEVTFGAGNVEVTGEWTKGDYTITYEYTYENVKDADKLEAPAPVAKSYGADLPEVAAATKDGYTVTDWVYYDADDNEITDGKMPAGNVTAKATQSGIPYTLTYTFTGEAPAGVTAPTDNGTYYIGDSKTLEVVTAPEGYTFSGWKLNDAVVTEVTFGTGNVEVTGEWTVNEYTITYLDDENQQIDVQTYAFGAEITPIADPDIDGKEFAGWVYTDENGDPIEGDLPETMPAYNIVATAIFNAAEYKVTYIVDGETYEEFDVTYNEPIDTPPVPDDKADAVFMGWTDDGGTTVYSEDEIGEMLMPNHDVEFTAVWSQLYSLTLQYEDGTAIGEVKYYAEGDDIDPVDEPAALEEGYKFSGWKYNDEDGSFIEGDLPDVMPAYDIVAVALFEKGEYTATYIVDGNEVESYDIVFGEDIDAPADPDKDGYDFAGWLETTDNKKLEEYTEGMPAKNLEFEAQWTPIDYTLTYTFTGEAPDGVTAPTDATAYHIGDSKTLEVITAPEGYTFSGWKLNDAVVTEVTFGTEDIEVTGEWTKGEYTITYEYTYENVKDADKLEAPAPVAKSYGDDLPEVAAATKDGYNVTEWKFYDADNNEITDGKMPAGNVTAKATQSGIPYTLTYTFTGEVPDGVTAPTDSTEYFIGDTVTLETVSEVTGYSFSGWKQDGTAVTEVTFGTEDIEVTGEWTKGEYTITYEYTYENVKDADKLEAPADVLKNFGDDLPDATAATKDGYNVTEWKFYDADNNEITDGKMPAGNVTAKATQSGIPYTLTYTFTGEVPEGVTAPTDDSTYYIGDSATLETVSSVDGYTFSGWKQDGTAVTEVTFGAGNIEVIGNWAKVSTGGVIKLMPKAGNTTTMIERGGKVETYNNESIEGFNSAGNARAKAKYAPYGISSVEQAYSNEYGPYAPDSATGYDNWFVYGLRTGMSAADLDTYIEVTDGGRYEATGLKRNKVVTGSVITVYDCKGTINDTSDDTVVEKFYVVIFGDVNCDGTVNASDTNEIDNEIITRNWTTEENYVSYKARAANLNTDASVNAYDNNALDTVIIQTHEINQTTGKVEAKA